MAKAVEVREFPLSECGLETTEQAATRRGQHPATVRNWVNKGKIAAAVIGAGRTARYLVRIADVDAIPILEPGAPEGNQFARKSEAPKPVKTSTPQKSRKKTAKA